MAAPKADERDRALLCTAKRSNGRGPCKAYAIAGHHVCAAHGGRSPQVREKAQEYLDRQTHSLLVALVKIATNERIDPHARVKAIKEALAHSTEVREPGQRVEVHRTSDLRPRVLDMLKAEPPALSAKAQEAVSITTLTRNALPPDISANTAPRNRNPKAAKQPK